MSTQVDLALARDFALALFIGVLVGIEREKDQNAAQERGRAGIRTFTLVALMGAASAWLAQRVGSPWIFVTALVLVGGCVVAGYVTQLRREPASVGLTTEISALVVCLLAGGVMYGEREVALALGIVTTALLAFKQPLHALVGRLDSVDIYAGLKLLIATFVVLPLLPREPVDPWKALNPHTLWLLTILIALLSLLGYVAVRWLGAARGFLITGALGGMASSTAVTLGFSRQSRELSAAGHMAGALSLGILASWVVMFARVLIEVAVVHRPLIPAVLAPLLAMGATAGVAMGLLLLLQRAQPSPGPASAAGEPGPKGLGLKNPFSLSAALRFALVFALIQLAVAGVRIHFPQQGLYPVAVLAGVTDVDAITLSMAELARAGGEQRVAATGIVLAVLSNTVVKTVLVLVLATRGLRLRLSLACAAILVAGAIGILAS